MKKAVLFSWNGSTGDVAHVASVAVGLQDAGYPVQLLIPKIFHARFEGFLKDLGIVDVAPVDPSTLTEHERRELEKEARAKGKPAEDSLKKLLQRDFERRCEESAATIIEICRQKDEIEFVLGDATSAHLIVPIRTAGIPYFHSSPMPYVATRHFFLSSRFPCVDKLGWLNLLRWRLGPSPRIWFPRIRKRITNARFRPYLRPPKGMEDEWAALHPTLTVNEFDEIYTKRINHLIAASPVIVGNPSDWGDNVQIVGYPQWKTKNLGVSEKLMKFVSSGEPPIYIGFGSYSDRRFNGPEGRVLLEQIARAADNCGDRIVFQSTLSSINSSEDLPDNVFPTDTVSHDWLFPRCKAVVCHGGYGTMHTTLMARTPLIIYPLHNDQFFLAKRAEQLGFALPYRASATYDRVTAKQFGRDFKKLQERCAAMRERANTVAARVEREDPIRGHLDAIEKGLRGTVIRGAR